MTSEWERKITEIKEMIDKGKAFLGIELGSTRIKAVLIGDDDPEPCAQGAYSWENSYINGYWTYSVEDIRKGIRGCYSSLKKDVRDKYGITLKKTAAMGISGMMHGFIALDENDELLTPFRTWRNTNTGRAARELTELLHFNIPMRWSISHLYQAVLDNEEYLSHIRHMTTLAGYIQYILTGDRAVGIGEASGMFPVKGCGYDEDMLSSADELLHSHGFDRSLADILPGVRTAGTAGAVLTPEGAAFLDEEGDLEPGIPLCPPEGDAGTGMVAANAVRPGTGNVSAGTSVFAMPVLENPLKGVYPEIDVVSTPDGKVCAMVHCNNCCSELDEWVGMFAEYSSLVEKPLDIGTVYTALYMKAMQGDPDCGGVYAYNFLSGEPVVKVDKGHPMYFRTPDSKMSLANFMRSQIYSALASLKLGMGILKEKENIKTDKIAAHGGFFKVHNTTEHILADALDTPVTVSETAGEGGAWGMALLAAYMMRSNGMSLADWLEKKVFVSVRSRTAYPTEEGKRGFDSYLERYKSGIGAQKALEEVKYNA